MVRMDELIREIHADEAIEISGNISDEQQKRVENRVMEAILSQEASRKKAPFLRRELLVFGLAAILLIGLCVTALGASNHDWDIALIQAMGLSNTDTLQLESGEVQINEAVSASATEYLNGKEEKKVVTITAVNSIGDKNSAFIQVNTDYRVPIGFDREEDYMIANDICIHISRKNPKKGSITTNLAAVTEVTVNEEGYVNLLIEISGCKNLNKSYVTINIKDLYLYEEGFVNDDARGELLLKGEWTLQWKYEYKSNTKTFYMLKPIQINEETYYISKIELSPISIQIDGFRMPWNRKEEYDGDVFAVNEIRYEDGTVQKLDGINSAGCNNGIWFDTFIGIHQLKEPVDTKQVKAILMNGNRILLP